MPKKFKGENTKAQEAKARKSAAKDAENERKQKQLEDEYWKDDDKHGQRKQQRKEEAERKRKEALEQKQVRQQMLEEESATLVSAKSNPKRLTRAEVQANQDRLAQEALASKRKEETPYDERPLEENINRMVVEGDEARSVAEAISVLSVKESGVDKHPEKRMKAAFAEYEEKNMPRLKAENSNLRLSQLKQMLKKDWMKSPENPMNAALLARK